MECVSSVDNVPQWKKDLIARLRNQNKSSSGNVNRDHHSTPHHSLAHRTVLQPNLTSKNESVASSGSSSNNIPEQCNVKKKMVQERAWADKKSDKFEEMVANNGYHKESDSDSSEELHYGPGIVNKLKNKYLSLALRESNSRPSILHMRKATSLENLLDDDDGGGDQDYKSRFNGIGNISNKYKNNYRRNEMKRARSVETISRLDNQTNNSITNRQSLHEETFIAVQKEGNDYPSKKIQDNVQENKFSHRINRPKRLLPIMNEKEKPPVDFVKQAKMIFEKRPEQRTRAPPQTGDVAAKVDSFNNIIVKKKVEAKVNKKTQIKSVKYNLYDKKVPNSDTGLLSPIPDVSKIVPIETERCKSLTNLSETPDLILTSSPLSSLPNEENIIPKKLTSPLLSPNRIKPASPLISPSRFSPKLTYEGAFDFTKKVSSTPINENVSDIKVPTSQQLEIDVNGYVDTSYSDVKVLQTKKSPPYVEKKIEKDLNATEIEKNTINTAKNKSSESVEVVNRNVVPKKQTRPKEPVSNTAVFNFTSSKRDVPDYISNDKSRLPGKPELPKPGEGGIIFIPGATILESFTDEDEEILRSLEGPPSPCDVTFINDNILIDGKSSMCQKSKRSKMKISFVEAGPDIYEYPSETSLMVDENPVVSPAQVGHSIPNLSGSSLATYTPKSSTESFQPGVTRSTPVPSVKPVETASDEPNFELDEVDKPFSSGNTTDILF
ncbi:uncharacterized protein LOC130895560 [Diorhabda carinulata]|uniref:uncharacterized protein LOC130895560 n=1 Tax=Diorhabda carinulata TaxID=1163345 RepID=UPI0025A12D4D|nr:uncharacterized protein LOC130895560 [Diorhabda carinulata]